MTMSGPGAHRRTDDAWQAALGDPIDPVDPKTKLLAPPPPPKRRLGHGVRNTVLVLLAVAVIAAGSYFVIKKSKDTTPKIDTGSLSLSLTTPAPSPSSSVQPVGLAADPAGHAAQLAQALDSVTTWAELAPYLKNLSTQGVPSACLNVNASNKAKCVFGAQNAKHHAVLIGDAAALDWMPEIVAELAPHGWDVQVLTLNNCPVSTVTITLGSAVDTDCADHHAFINDELASIKPSLIFASDRDVDLQYATAPPKPKGAPRQKPEDAFTAGLTSAVTAYARTGKVVVLGSAPGTKALAKCINIVPAPKGCSAPPRPEWLAYQALERKAVAGHASYVDPTPYFCSDNHCPAVVGVTPTYTDGVSVTAAFAKSLTFVFAPYVGA